MASYFDLFPLLHLSSRFLSLSPSLAVLTSAILADITYQSIAKAFDKELEYDEETKRSFFSSSS
jgi:hypothetical protein